MTTASDSKNIEKGTGNAKVRTGVKRIVNTGRNIPAKHCNDCDLLSRLVGCRGWYSAIALRLFKANVHSDHVGAGGQEQKHFSPPGTKLHFHEKSSRNFIVLTSQQGHLVTWLQTKNCATALPAPLEPLGLICNAMENTNFSLAEGN